MIGQRRERYAIAVGVVYRGEPRGRAFTGIGYFGWAIAVARPFKRRAGDKGDDVRAGESYMRPAKGVRQRGSPDRGFGQFPGSGNHAVRVGQSFLWLVATEPPIA